MTSTKTIKPEQEIAPPMEEEEEQLAPFRVAIIEHIKERLGSGLSTLYSGAIKSSVGTGSYDHEWHAGPPYVRIEKYVAILKEDWLKRKIDSTDLLERVYRLLDFGTDAEKADLKRLLQLD